jgi:hypothetical protein
MTPPARACGCLVKVDVIPQVTARGLPGGKPMKQYGIAFCPRHDPKRVERLEAALKKMLTSECTDCGCRHALTHRPKGSHFKECPVPSAQAALTEGQERGG